MSKRERELLAEIEEKRALLLKSKAVIQSMESDNDESRRLIDELQRAINQYASQSEMETARAQGLEADLQHLRQQRHDLETDVSDREAALRVKTQRVSTLTEQLASTEGRVEVLESEVRDISNHRDSLLSEGAAKDRKIAALEGELAEERQENEAQGNTLAERKGTIENLDAALVESEAREEALTKQLEQARSDARTREDQLLREIKELQESQERDGVILRAEHEREIERLEAQFRLKLQAVENELEAKRIALKDTRLRLEENKKNYEKAFAAFKDRAEEALSDARAETARFERHALDVEARATAAAQEQERKWEDRYDERESLHRGALRAVEDRATEKITRLEEQLKNAEARAEAADAATARLERHASQVLESNRVSAEAQIKELREEGTAREAKMALKEAEWISRVEGLQREFASGINDVTVRAQTELARRDAEAELRESALRKRVEEEELAMRRRAESLVRGLEKLGREQKAAHAAREALKKEIPALQSSLDSEHKRRRESERTLREAASAFKREMWEKNEQLHAIQVELRQMREWQTKSLESFVSNLYQISTSRGARTPRLMEHVIVPVSATPSVQFSEEYGARGGSTNASYLEPMSAPVGPRPDPVAAWHAEVVSRLHRLESQVGEVAAAAESTPAWVTAAGQRGTPGGSARKTL